jgi:anti-sigma factor RsiW
MRYLLQSGHISEESLGLHACGDLHSSRVAVVERHLAGCHACRSQLEEIQMLIMALKAYAHPVPPRLSV